MASKKKGIFSFYNCAAELVGRNAQQAEAFIGKAYMAGETIVATIPLFQSGFVHKLAEKAPNWHLLADAYLSRPLPVVVTGAFFASDFLMMKNRWKTGQGVLAVGAAILTFDLFKSHEVAEAATYSLTVLSASFGTLRSALSQAFGNAPNRFIRETLARIFHKPSG